MVELSCGYLLPHSIVRRCEYPVTPSNRVPHSTDLHIGFELPHLLFYIIIHYATVCLHASEIAYLATGTNMQADAMMDSRATQTGTNP